MYGLLALGVLFGVVALLGPKLLLLLGFVVSIATFAFPLGLVLLVAIGIVLTWRSTHRPVDWGQPE